MAETHEAALLVRYGRARRHGQRIRQRRNVFHSGHCGSRDLNCGHFILRPVKKKEELVYVCVCITCLYVCLSLYYAARGGGGDHGALIPS